MVGDTTAGAGAGTALTASQSLPESTREAGGGALGAIADLAAMLFGGASGGTLAGVATGGPKFLTDKVKGSMPAKDVPGSFGAESPVTNAAADRAAAFVQSNAIDPNAAAASIRKGANEFRDMGAARAVLESGDPKMSMREVLDTIGNNAAASKAWERSVTDHIVDRITNVDPAGVSSGDRAINYAKLVKTFRRYEDALGELYSGQSDKMHALQRVQRMLAPLAKQVGPASNAAPVAEGNERAWKMLEAGLKAHYGILKGGGVLRTIRISASLLRGGADVTERLVARMMFDPELAAHLLTRKVAEVGTPAWNDKLAKLIRRVEVGRGMFDEEE